VSAAGALQDAASWAANPAALGLLRRAARMLWRGEVSAAQLEGQLLNVLKVIPPCFL
jgi:hypothetical protein